MNDEVELSWLSHKSGLRCCKHAYFDENSSLVNMDELCNCISVAVDRVHEKLRPGLPKSTYQLELFKYLDNEGMHLMEETSLLTKYANNEPCRQIIIVNGVLVIECITEEKNINQHHKRIVFDLQINNHVIGLLINFSKKFRCSGISKIYQSAVHH